MSRIGILALQGGFAAHARRLAELGHDPVEVRNAVEFESIDGLVLPGGESSVHLLLIDRFGLDRPLREFARSGKPVLATCAGLVLAARRVASPAQPSFGFIDVDVVRNAYGRQRHSFEARSDNGELPLIFIRAPKVVRTGPAVTVLATFNSEPVLLRQGNVTAAAFHPELTGETQVHRDAFGPPKRRPI